LEELTIMNFKKTLVATAMATAMGITTYANAAVITGTFTGAFTMLNAKGQITYNSDVGSCYDVANTINTGQCARTAISGSMSFDTTTGAGSASITPFSFFGSGLASATSTTFQAIGNGFGGPGTLVLGNMGFNWNFNYGIPVSIVMDASGFFGGPLVAGASDNTGGASPIGGALMATTTWNTTAIGTVVLGTNPSGTLPLVNDTVVDVTNADVGIGGSPMATAPFAGYNANFDVMTFTPDATVPVPAAAWLFGSGLVGLVGVARRKRNA
jgi:hypothetical protein